MSLRVLMMGTGEFAVPAFLALCDSHHEVVGLFTQPDRTGRGHHAHQPHPMKDAALDRNIPVFQPESINTPESLDDLRSLNADTFIVAAYGQILKQELLHMPPRGVFNIHASLLPRYRGASPIQYAIMCGETETGITIFRIEPKLDAGPMVRQESLSIGSEETSGELHDRLAQLSGKIIVETVDAIEAGSLEPIVQAESDTVYAPRITKQEGIIDWTRAARQIHDHVRAMQPWPKAFTWFQHADHEPQRILIHRTGVMSSESTAGFSPGAITSADEHQVLVATGNGMLEIIELQPEGKRRMSAVDFLHGHALQPGDRFETPPS